MRPHRARRSPATPTNSEWQLIGSAYAPTMENPFAPPPQRWLQKNAGFVPEREFRHILFRPRPDSHFSPLPLTIEDLRPAKNQRITDPMAANFNVRERSGLALAMLH